MKRNDTAQTPQIAYYDSKANIEAWPNPTDGMEAIASDTNEKGTRLSGVWYWTNPTEATAKFQRNLTNDLVLRDGECLVISGYIETGEHSIVLEGDSVLEIL